MRRLIVNADDLGLTRGVNRGIFETISEGVVTSTTLMANSAAFDDAVERAHSSAGKGASTGCHVLLVDGAPLAPADSVKSLLQNGSGNFQTNLMPFVSLATRGKISPGEIEAEATAQFRKLQGAGISISHFDTHKHTHIFPAVFQPLLRAAKACGIKAVRNPFAPVKPLAFAHLVRRPKLWKRYSQVKILRRYEDAFRSAVADAGLKTTDGSFGVVSTGHLDAKLFAAIMGCLPEGTWEFVCHPGYSDRDLDGVQTRLRESRDTERQVLTSPAAREILEQQGVELISYGRL
ncbi:MAG: ChbG/HpnK family deacetylase [Terriglobales bacterium]